MNIHHNILYIESGQAGRACLRWILRRIVLLFFMLLSLLYFPAESNAYQSACLTGVDKQIYSKKKFDLRVNQFKSLHIFAKSFAKKEKLFVSGDSLYLGGVQKGPQIIDTILSSRGDGIIIEFSTYLTDNIGVISVRNTCWAPNEPWREIWDRLNSSMYKAGFKVE